MDTFIQAIAVVSAICFGIFAVSIFLTLLNYLNGLIRGTAGKNLVAQDFIKKDVRVTVRLSGAETIEAVKFIGFTAHKNQGNAPIPFPFSRMAVFENGKGEKIFIPSERIHYIKELPAQTPSSQS